MIHSLILRTETSNDINAINNVIVSAFSNSSHGLQNEDKLVAQLRADNALALSVVAEVNDQIVGHIAFSKITMTDQNLENWYILAPLSVAPEFQKQSLGKQLLKSGLAGIKKKGAKGCLCVGDIGYYGRFGFSSNHGLVLEGIPKEYILVQNFTDDQPRGMVVLHPAFTYPQMS